MFKQYLLRYQHRCRKDFKVLFSLGVGFFTHVVCLIGTEVFANSLRAQSILRNLAYWMRYLNQIAQDVQKQKHDYIDEYFRARKQPEKRSENNQSHNKSHT